MLDVFATMLEESRGADADAAVAAAVDWAQEHDQTLGDMLWWFANPTGQDSYDFAECKFFILGIWLKQMGEPRFKDVERIPQLTQGKHNEQGLRLKRSVLALFPEVRRTFEAIASEKLPGDDWGQWLASLGFRVDLRESLQVVGPWTRPAGDGITRWRQTLTAPDWIPPYVPKVTMDPEMRDRWYTPPSRREGPITRADAGV